MIKEQLVDLIESSIVKNWDNTAMTNYRGDSISFGKVGEQIARLHILYDACNIKSGDKIALVGKNSINWAITYLSAITYEAVIVPILPDFKPADIHHIVNHSEAKLLFIADNIFENLDLNKVPQVHSTFSLNDFSLLDAKKADKINKVNANMDTMLKKQYPDGLNPSNLAFKNITNDKLAVLSYTSGTTGFTKGVMITHNCLAANVVYANKNMPLEPGDNIVSFLPLAHTYGCAFEFLWPFTLGVHITFLTKTPSPQIILQAFKEVRPRLVLAVPLIMEKIYKKQILPVLNKPSIKLLLKTPLLNKLIEGKVRQKLVDSFGGNFHEVVIGGAPLSQEVEEFLHRVKFPFSIGYGMTECGPLISYANWDKTKLGSAGRVVDSLEIKTSADNPYDQVGEIMVRGENIMLGYYKNKEATRDAFTHDGWMRTGDLGKLDEEGFVFIKGRNKSMILGASGQNIYPEEIEARLNNLPFVQESLVIEKKGKLVALIYPDYELADRKGMTEHDLKKIYEQQRKTLNDSMPAYMGLAESRIFAEEFEKTPKKSIKRYLYDQHA